MNETFRAATTRNPFSTRFVRPGAIPYCFPHGTNAEELLRRLEKNRWRGQIVGPHGSGKSALLATLIPLIEHVGRRTLLVELHDGQRRLPVDLRTVPRLDSASVVIVDGYEQLGALARWRLGRFCRRRRAGLLVTAHVPVGFPGLFRTTTDLYLAKQIVAKLLGEAPAAIPPEQVADSLSKHQGNLREMLFDLYDRYELKV